MAVNPEYLKSLEKCRFEECLRKLDAIVREMESGNVPLEDMVSKFEEGSAIASVCHRKLNSLKQKIELLQPEREAAENMSQPDTFGS
ncbi:MAG: exodeoxyribonuclease VII small subunit [Lentisphaeria bacterium]|nr:exodeoxyribonuclease VII small subunit [Lentisphaeria bacterium]